MRRRLREAVRAHYLRITMGMDLVLVPREAAARAVYPDLRAAVSNALDAAGLLDKLGGDRGR